jgi:CubicO group peptidase (beta-lactamase class C family)
MKENEVVGLSIALLQNSKLVWKRAYGLSNFETQDELREDHLMDTGSLTKPVVAYIVLQLSKKGILDLDVPLSNYLEEQYIPDEKVHQITARMVLSHNPGLPNWRPGRFDGDPKPLEIYLTPGTRYSYSGEGYVYLQKVVEQITNQTLDEIALEYVFLPLGMTESSFTSRGIEERPVAPGHNLKMKPNLYHYDSPNAAFSLRSTPKDYSKFLAAILSPPEDDALLLTPIDIKNMLTPQISVTNDDPPYYESWPKTEVQENPYVSWSLGWGLQHNDDRDFFWHWGDNGAYKAFTLASTVEGIGVVLMSNSNSGSKIWKVILKTLYGENLPIISYLDTCHPGYL